MTGRLLPPCPCGCEEQCAQSAFALPPRAVAPGRGSSLAEVPGQARRPRPEPGGPRRTMAWAQGDLTSSLSIVIALAACLSATTSEGRNGGGPGVTGQCWGHPRDGSACSDVSTGLSPAGLGFSCSQGSAAPGSCLPEFANPGAFAPEAKLRSCSGGPDSAAVPAAPLAGGMRLQGWPERGQGHRHQLSPGHPHQQQQRVGRAAWDGMGAAGGQGRGAEDEGGWKGHSGGKLLVRERAGNF